MENTERLIEIAKEEERLKGDLGRYFDRVKEIQSKIEGGEKFQSLIRGAKSDNSVEDVRRAAREAAEQAAEKEGVSHPPLPSWWQERMTYDWGDALIDDLMGNSADLTSSPNPSPIYMGGEYGRLRRKVERVLRGWKEEERFLLEEEKEMRALFSQKQQQHLRSQHQTIPNALSLSESTSHENNALATRSTPSALSDKLISDLLRSHRDHHGTRTSPNTIVGLASSLQLLFQDLQIPRSTLGTYSYTSLLTCCKTPWEARKVNEMRKQDGVRSNEYFWSAMVDVYARVGDYRGAEGVLDEMLEESNMEYEKWEADIAAKEANSTKKGTKIAKKVEPPIAIPPLPAYTSFFSACHKLISRGDVHPSIKSDAAKRAWSRWKEMRIHSVPPDVMAYGALMRVFAAQGRAEKALDLLVEIMAQMMMPVSAEQVLNGKGMEEEVLRSMDGDNDGWYDDREGRTVRVKPTTLIFTSALKAVAKSHEIALRFSGGKSKKNRRRESIASYHGRLARKIVILAEQAEVEQDDGFVSALMLCAAVAGDSSTARAIYLGSKVRRMDHLRTCGGKDHLRRLQGLVPEEEQSRIGMGGGAMTPEAAGGMGRTSSNVTALRTIEEEYRENHKAYELREYGMDTRILSTLLLAHSRAMESQGLGSMWAGRFNRGYLCENSLRWIEAYNRPRYENMAIPGLSSVEAGLAAEGWEPENFDDDDGRGSKQLRKKKKFNIQQIADDGEGNRVDDMDPFFDNFDLNDEEEAEKNNDLLQLNGGGGDDINRDWLDDQLVDEEENAQKLLPDIGITTMEFRVDQTSVVQGNNSLFSQNSGEYRDEFDDDDSDDEELDNEEIDSAISEQEAFMKSFPNRSNDPNPAEDIMLNDGDDIDDIDGYFDEEEFNRLMEMTMKGMDESKGGDADELDNIPGVATNDFAAFRAHLKAELVEEGATHDVDEEEARQLFDMMRTYYDDGDSIRDSDFFESHGSGKGDKMDEKMRERSMSITNSGESVGSSSADFLSNLLNNGEIKSMAGNPPQVKGFMNGESNSLARNREEAPLPEMKRNLVGVDMSSKTLYADDYIEWAKFHTVESSDELAESNKEPYNEMSEVEPPPIDIAFKKQNLSRLEEEDLHITELQQALPGLPRKRIEKISNEFARVLGYPSILRLAVVLRENMPDDLSPQWLTKKNLTNANFLMSEAEKDGLVDIHLLNGMLQVQTNSGRIDPAIRFHDVEYKKHGIVSSVILLSI